MLRLLVYLTVTSTYFSVDYDVINYSRSSTRAAPLGMFRCDVINALRVDPHCDAIKKRTSC